MSVVTLTVNYVDYSEWEAVQIYRSMQSCAGAFSLKSARMFDLGFDEWDIRLGDEFKLWIDDTVVCTGHIESIIVTAYNDSHIVEIRGRDKTADLIDCNYVETPNEWKMQPVSKLVKNLCSPFGIEVAINPLVVADANKIVETFKADEGQSVYDIIAALLRDSTLLPLTEGDGALTITRASLAELSWDTISDSNTSGIMLDYNDYDRYSSYIVKGQGIGSDNKTTKDYIEPSATIADSGIARYRPSVIFAETATDNGKCKQRAIFEAHNRAGHSRRARLDVIGWQQFDGSLWAINSTVVVDLSLAGINKTMLIEEIEFIQDSENGEIARVSVVDIDTYGTSPALDITTELDR